MKKLILINLIIIFCSVYTFSQSADSLKIVKFHVCQNDVKLSKEELHNLLATFPETYAEYEKYKKKGTVGSAAMLIGSGFVLYLGAASLSNSLKDVNNLSEGNLETSDQANLVFPAIAAVGFVSIGAVFGLSARDHLIKAVNIFNAKNGMQSNKGSYIDFELTHNGVSLVYRF